MGFKRSDLGYCARRQSDRALAVLPVPRRGDLMPGNGKYAVRAYNELRQAWNSDAIASALQTGSLQFSRIPFMPVLPAYDPSRHVLSM
jgi:hypothetical protein